MVKNGRTHSGVFFESRFSSDKNENLILLMGYSGSRKSWPEHFLLKLSEYFNLVLIDNRGTGESDGFNKSDDFSTGTMASDVQNVIDLLAIGHYFLLGYSLGGCIALQYALTHPNSLRGLILLSTTAGGLMFVPPSQDLLTKLSNPPGETILEKSKSMWEVCLSMSSIEKLSTELMSMHVSQSENLTPRFVFAAQMKAFQQYDVSARLKELQVRTLVITGDSDRLIPPENSLKLAENIPNSNIYLIQNCEHMPAIEAPEILISQIQNFAYQARISDDRCTVPEGVGRMGWS